MRLWRDGAKGKGVSFKYETAIMLLHIHKVLLRAYHSMQSTLPCHHGSRGGGITATVGGCWRRGGGLHMGMGKKRERKKKKRKASANWNAGALLHMRAIL